MDSKEQTRAMVLSERGGWIYDVVIIGAGASGLMCAASPAWADPDMPATDSYMRTEIRDTADTHPAHSGPRAENSSTTKRLILEGGNRPGLKLLMSGGGHCNITHEGDMRELLAAYGAAGKSLRPLLYRHGNRELKAFLDKAGVPLYADETGRVLPVSMQARDVLDVYLAAAEENGFRLQAGQRVTGISIACQEGCSMDADRPAVEDDGSIAGADDTAAKTDRFTPEAGEAGRSISGVGDTAADTDDMNSLARDGDGREIIYCIQTDRAVFKTKNVVIATGGCSYPVTGSDGEMFVILRRDLDVDVTGVSPALVPVIPEDYPYQDLAGITLPHIRISIHKDGQKSVHREGALLFTHGAFSGPCALDISSHAARGSRIALNYVHPMTFDDAYALIRAQGIRTAKAVAAAFCVPRRLAALLVQRAADSPKRLAHYLTEDTFPVAGTEGFNTAMVTKGGAVLGQFDLSSMELTSHPGVFVIGEALDADGISGGYNLQLCWSTAQTAAQAIADRCSW